MTEPLAPLDDELDLWLAPGRVVPEVTDARAEQALRGVQQAIALTPAPAAPPPSPSGVNSWWFAGGGLAVGLLVGAGAMWALIDTAEPRVVAVETAEPAPTGEMAVAPQPEPPAVEPELAPARPEQPTLRPLPAPPSAPAASVADEPAASPGSEGTTPPATESTLVAERRIIDAALAQVSRGNPAAALSSVARHQQSYPSGQLTEAREIVRIRALAALGRAEEARAALQRFRARFPNSAAASSLSELDGL